VDTLRGQRRIAREVGAGPVRITLYDMGGDGDCGLRAFTCGLLITDQDDRVPVEWLQTRLDAGAGEAVREHMLATLRGSRLQWEPLWQMDTNATETTEAGPVPTDPGSWLQAAARPRRYLCWRGLQALAEGFRIDVLVWVWEHGRWDLTCRFLAGKGPSGRYVSLAMRDRHFLLMDPTEMPGAFRLCCPRDGRGWPGRGGATRHPGLSRRGSGAEEGHEDGGHGHPGCPGTAGERTGCLRVSQGTGRQEACALLGSAHGAADVTPTDEAGAFADIMSVNVSAAWAAWEAEAGRATHGEVPRPIGLPGVADRSARRGGQAAPGRRGAPQGPLPTATEHGAFSRPPAPMVPGRAVRGSRAHEEGVATTPTLAGRAS